MLEAYATTAVHLDSRIDWLKRLYVSNPRSLRKSLLHIMLFAGRQALSRVFMTGIPLFARMNGQAWILILIR